MGPRLVAFAASLLFSRRLAGVLCRKYPREAQVFSGYPSTYTWQRLRSQNAVYMKVAVDWRYFSSVEHYRQPSTFMYIGSTSQSVFRRESNRLSVAKKLLTGGEAQA